jgi:hypothetical protein
MTPLMLRQLWSLVERTQANILLSLDDASLVQWLIRQFKRERSLDHSEATIVSAYIHSHITLIRDLAQER